MEDSQIIAAFFARDKGALEQLSTKYHRLYCAVLREILDDPLDVEECANDILVAVWKNIPPQKPDNLPAYLCTLARRMGIDRLRYHTRKKRGKGYQAALSELEGCLPAAPGVPWEDRLHIRQLLSDFVRNLDPETRVLFVRRYIYMESVASLSQRYQIPENTVAVRLYRARKKLKKVLVKEEIQI